LEDEDETITFGKSGYRKKCPLCENRGGLACINTHLFGMQKQTVLSSGSVWRDGRANGIVRHPLS
jgi:hypothetical protein